ncbi:MAG: hypothetical protein IAF94_19225 [Pirellulaceae bacterium]|nr:hypothetical protein [Pirellulaceae bacterium]
MPHFRAYLESLEPRAMLYAPIGSETLVNVSTVDSQQVSNYALADGGGARSVALSAGGSYVVAWESVSSSATGNAYIRVFNADGSPLTGEIQVNAITARTPGSQFSTSRGFDPTVAVDQSGNFVVVFKANGSADSSGIYARRFQANGTPIGNEFLVNAASTDKQTDTSIAMAPDGRFVVTWTHENILKSGKTANGMQGDVYAQRFAANGTKLGSQFLVHAKSSLPEGQSTVAVDASGNFAIGWTHSDYTVFGGGTSPGHLLVQRYNAAGNKVGSQIELPTTGAGGTGSGTGVSLAYDGIGNLIASWRESGTLLAQIYGPSGGTVGGRIVVNDASTACLLSGSQQIASDQAGNFVVTWAVRGSDPGTNAEPDIMARRFTTGGVPDATGIFQVNTTTTLGQSHPTVALTADGRKAIFVWDGNGAGDDSGVFMQEYDLTGPAAPAATLALDPNSVDFLMSSDTTKR